MRTVTAIVLALLWRSVLAQEEIRLSFDSLESDGTTLGDDAAGTGRIVGAKATDGIRGSGLLLDGRRGFVDLGDRDVAKGDFTLAAWVCPRSVASGDRMILAKDRSGVGSHQLRFYLGAGNKLGFMLSDASGNGIWPFETQPGAVPARRWSHVAVTRQGRDFALYINGKRVATRRADADIRHENDLGLRIGARYGPSGDAPESAFDGIVDEVTIHRRALPAEELALPEDLLQAAARDRAFPVVRRPPSELARPAPEQAAWQDLELGMFIHFAPNTWQDREYDDLSTPLDEISPERLDTEQWVDVAESMGARYIVFVAKHVGGFCWWQTETTDYSVRSIPWRDGKGDVLRDLSESCRKRGMGLGVYLSPADGKHGAGVGGKCATEEAQQRYAELYRAQLTEVLSGYGEMMEVWFDGSLIVEVGDILKRHAPRAMVFQGKYATIRWVGNEEGIAPYPAWNAVLTKRDPARWGVYTAADGDPEGDTWLPNECDARIRSTWFWNTRNAGTLKSVEKLMEMYYGSVGRGAVLLLNNTPDTTGLIPEADARRSAELGAEIRRRFGSPIAETHGRGDLVELALAEPTEIDHAIIMEDIREGERVLEYVVEVAEEDGPWKEVARGSAIGHKKIDRFPLVRAARVRWRSIDAQAEPIVRKLAVFRVGSADRAGGRDAETDRIGAKIGGWSPDRVGAGWTTLEVDLVPWCKNATQYRVELRPTGTPGDVEVGDVSLVLDGVDAPHFIRRVDPRSFDVTLTGIGRTMVLRIPIRARGGSSGTGEIRIRETTPR